MNFLNDFVLLLKARYPIIYIVTNEEERIEYLIKYCAKKYVNRTYYSWDFVDGYQGNPNDTGFAARNPLEALDLVDKLTPETASLFVLKDYDNFLKDFSVIRKLKNLSRSLKTQPKNIIIVSSEINIPDSLKEFVTLLEFPLPSYSEILEELNRLTSSLQQDIKPEVVNELTMACQGLSLERIRRVLSKIIAKYGEIDESSPSLILQEKKQIIQQTQLLEFCLADKGIGDLGGLDNFKDWLQLRKKAFSQEAIEYGLPYPKGLLLVGVQGTGKSIAAKIIANEWRLPLLRLDFGRLFASLIGQSEQRVRKMIEIAEALSPCILWVDEIDKVFGQMESKGDSGTSNRVLGTFITWLSEKNSQVFIVATANNFKALPLELIRKGRFDEIFFVGLPSKDERQKIFKVHLSKFRPESFENYDLNLLSELTNNFSGAEIRQSIIEGMHFAFTEDREFTTNDICLGIDQTIPLAQIDKEQIQEMQEWALSGRVRLASSI